MNVLAIGINQVKSNNQKSNLQRQSNYANLNQNSLSDSFSKSRVSFEGKGEVIVQYHQFSKKLSKDLRNKIASEIINKLKITQKLLVENPKIKVNPEDLSFEYLEKTAKDYGFVNKNGEIVGIDPKKVIIRDGKNEIPDNFKADEIIQEGGEIDGVLEGQRVYVSGGSNKGIKTSEFFSQLGKFNTRQDGNQPRKLVNLFDGTKVSGPLDVDALQTSGKVDLGSNANAEVFHAGSYATDISGKLKADRMEFHTELSNTCENRNKVRFLKDSDIEVGSTSFKGDVEVGGKFNITSDLPVGANYGQIEFLKDSDVNIKGKFHINNDMEIRSNKFYAKQLIQYPHRSLLIGKSAVVTVDDYAIFNGWSRVLGKINVEKPEGEIILDNSTYIGKTGKINNRKGVVDVAGESEVAGTIKADEVNQYDEATFLKGSKIEADYLDGEKVEKPSKVLKKRIDSME